MMRVLLLLRQQQLQILLLLLSTTIIMVSLSSVVATTTTTTTTAFTTTTSTSTTRLSRIITFKNKSFTTIASKIRYCSRNQNKNNMFAHCQIIPFWRQSLLSTTTTTTTALSLSDKSAAMSTSTTTTNNIKRNNKSLITQHHTNTGGLRKLPVVKAPIEISNRARNIAKRVRPDSNVKNVRNRARKHGCETINALSQSLCIPLRDIVNSYKYEIKYNLHPFERIVAELTIASKQKKDGVTLQSILDEIHDGRKMILEYSKDYIYKIKNECNTAKEINIIMNEAIDNIIQLFTLHVTKPIEQIITLQKSLRNSPIIQLNVPTIVLVGAPNVGKSSIVRTISSATPEVNNYPFTTRGMTLGHVEVFWNSNNNNNNNNDEDITTTATTNSNSYNVAKAIIPDNKRKNKKEHDEVIIGKYEYSQLCQIMDTPGVLVRTNENERNEMEQLTIASMRHIPTAVCYVLDLSGHAGEKCSSIHDQLLLRKHIRSRFPKRPWIDIISKVDLGIDDTALKEFENILKEEENTKKSYIKLSINDDNIGINELRTEILYMLNEIRIVLDAMAAIEEEK